MSNRTFTNVDDRVLVELINAAQTRVVFIAPGLRAQVAAALADALQRLPPGNVSVILDVDGEVCRLGFGDIQGLELIQQETKKAAARLYHQPGIRIGLVIVDDSTVVYSPTALYIEAGSTQPEKPNGIVLKQAVPAAVETACGGGPEGEATREVGMDFLPEEAVQKVKEDLKARPPKQFDIARMERVFNSALHFVDLKVEDYRLATKKIRLDVKLFGFKEDFLKERLENTFKPFDDAESLTVQIPKLDEAGKPISDQTELFNSTLERFESFDPERIDLARSRLKQDFLFDVPKFGVVIRRQHKEAFEKRLIRMREQLRLYKGEVEKVIDSRLGEAKEKLCKSLLEHVVNNPPPEWKKFIDGDKFSSADAKELLDTALDHAFEKFVTCFNPVVHWIYKDVTYETIHNPDFRRALEKAFGKKRADELFSEHDAAPEKV